MVEGDVGDHRHAPVPGVRGVQPAAQPHFDHRQIDAGLGEPAERDGGQQLELGGIAVAAGHPIGHGQHFARSAA